MINPTTTVPGQESADNSQECKFVRISGASIVTKFEGVERSHRMAAQATVTCDGKPFKVEDLKRGNQVRITTHADHKSLAIRIEFIPAPQSQAASPSE